MGIVLGSPRKANQGRRSRRPCLGRSLKFSLVSAPARGIAEAWRARMQACRGKFWEHRSARSHGRGWAFVREFSKSLIWREADSMAQSLGEGYPTYRIDA